MAGMSEQTDNPQTDAEALEAQGVEPEPENPAPRSPRRTFRIVLILIILAALAVAAWFGWQWWQQQQRRVAAASQASHDQVAAVAELRQDNTTLQSQLQTSAQEQATLKTQLEAARKSGEAMQGKLEGLSRRVTQLESAVSGLSQKQISGAERMRLEDVEMLLTQASQRYTLLHDGVSALAALRMARKQLADVDDPAFSGIARTLDDEISTLAATRPARRQSQLDQLEQLRQQWPALPLKPLDKPETEAPATGAWARIWGALSTLVVVRREGGADDVGSGNRHLARQVGAIDLARAEAALLSNDPATALAAVQRASASLKRDYDPASSMVDKAQASLAQLAAQLDQASRADVQLGAALTALRNQLQVRVMNNLPLTVPATTPASAATAGGA